ncbi:MAG: hypothetical protein WCT04_22610 [Planctomycetota bacterium]
MRRTLLVSLVLVAFLSLMEIRMFASEVGFAEDFALSTNRDETLKQLIPGTDDYYYYNCVHLQNTTQFAKVDDLLKKWIQQYGENGRVQEIQNRQALLAFGNDPKKTFDFVSWRLGLQFNHQRHIPGQKPNYPTRLDPTTFAPATLKTNALNRHGDLSGFEDSALDMLMAAPEFTGDTADVNRRRQLLQRLKRPDYEGLAKVVVADLKAPNSSGFGSLGIHRALLLSQLDECAKLMPDLLNQQNFISVYMSRLQPNPDIDWKHDDKEHLAHLERLWAFASKLQPAFNSLKAHILFERLAFDQKQGTYDKDRFLEYVKLPRAVHYAQQKYLERPELRNVRAQIGQNFPDTLLPVVGNDESLVRDYFMHFFLTEDSIEPYTAYVADSWLKDALAETKILSGAPDPEKWYALLNNPVRFQELKERVDIVFAPTNKNYFRSDEAVSMALDVKNVKTLMVKVYEINTANYYRELQREVETSINLDGLVANQETPYTYEEPPLRRVRRTFDFAALKNPGVYVVDFIGNGRSSRTVVRKGRVRALEHSSAAGHIFSVLDESNVKQKTASIWLSGHEYKSNKDGDILIPFTNAPGRQNIVIMAGNVISLDRFEHRAENYKLMAGIYVEREALLKRSKANVIVRPMLYINGAAMGFKALEEVTLVLQSTDRDGVVSSKDVRDFKLEDDKESVYEFQVPENLSDLNITLKAKIQVLSTSAKIDLSDSARFTLNQIDKTEHVADVHFSRLDTGCVLSILGKTGEALADRAINVDFKHRDFKESIHVTLQSGPDGRIDLGALEAAGIVSLSTPGLDNNKREWALSSTYHSLPYSLNAKSGDVIRVPYMGKLAAPARADVSLLEKRGSGFLADQFAVLTIKDGYYEIPTLSRGDYELYLKDSNHRISVKVAEGVVVDGYASSNARVLEVVNADPLQIASIDVTPDAIKITLKNADKFARLHVAATRFEPAFSILGHLGKVEFAEPMEVQVGVAESQYLAGRDIGDEYRYIMDRKYSTKYPGNMLNRPSLLLNPWAIRKTETSEEQAQSGGDFGNVGGGGRTLMSKRQGGVKGIAEVNTLANFDFLPAQAVLLANLKPDANGVITIARKDLGPGQQIHLLAADHSNTVYRQLSLPETKTVPNDLRLAQALDSTKHFTERKQVSVIEGNQNFELADVATSTIEPYDTIAKAYGLYVTLGNAPQLPEFNFITRWPSLKPEEKREFYSKHASHELSFFVFKKDPEFFKAVVQPYLKNKKDKTFIDHFLIEDDLSEFLKPWAYGQLNIVERILLIQRIQGEAEAGARHVNDLFDLLPPNIERFNSLYLTAIKGSALDTGDALGLEGAKQQMAPAKPLALGFQKEDKAADGMNRNAGMAFAAPSAPATAAAPAAKSRGLDRDAGEKGEAQNERLASDKSMNQLQEKRKALKDDAAAEPEMLKKSAPSDAKESAGRYMRARREAGKAFEDESELRQAARQFYRKLDKTEEWVENNYHHLPIENQNAALVTVNAFWKDYAAYLSKGGNAGFRSVHLADASRNFTDIMFALAVLDLPFEAQKHTTTFNGAKMTLAAKSPIILFHKEIKEGADGGKSQILISENFFKFDDRYRFENNERFEKYVSGEFLTHAVYGCQIVVTNPTANPQKLELLMQIPAGAIPVKNGFYTKGSFLDVNPYATSSAEYYFYFPLPGTFAHYPVQIAKNEKIIAFTPGETLTVVEKLTKPDTTSWDYVSQNGTPEETIAYLKANNIDRLNLELIAWRMKDAAFFTQVSTLLAQRHVYHNTLQSYAIKHGDVAAAREFLQHADGFLSQCGPIIDTKLVTIDPVIRKTYQVMEYNPLVNARAHRLGKNRKILNDRFAEQYQRLLHVLTYSAQLDNVDRMAVTYYLLLQDRVEEGLALFDKVDPNALATRLQHDYFTCYTLFYKGDAKAARIVADKYTAYPVDRWRNSFAEVRAQCDEIDGKDNAIVDKDDKKQKQAALAATEPNLDFTVEAKKVAINYQNVVECRVNYYKMDIELLFSGNPFVQEYAGQFSYIRPNKSDVVALPAGQNSLTFDLPQEFLSSNVMVEIVTGGVKKSRAYYANSLAVQVVENYGQVKVLNATTNKPVAKAYVKIYAKNKSGVVAFYKDGYTDLRGKLDYASLSTNEIDNVQKFSILVLSENDGALVREAAPPKQ